MRTKTGTAGDAYRPSASEAVREIRTDIEALKRDALADLHRFGLHDLGCPLGPTDEPEIGAADCDFCRCLSKWGKR